METTKLRKRNKKSSSSVKEISRKTSTLIEDSVWKRQYYNMIQETVKESLKEPSFERTNDVFYFV